MARFEIRTGKWGCYFYDNENGSDVTLQQAVDKMNAADRFQTAINLPLLRGAIANTMLKRK